MQLIAILLTTVSVLTLLSGVVVFFGSKKGERVRSFWFFVATIFATIWMVAISLFLVAKPEWESWIPICANLTYISAIYIDIALLGYICWRQKFGQPLAIIFLLLGSVITGFFLADPSQLYSSISLTNAGNSIVVNMGPLYFAYIAFFCMLVPTVILSLLYQVVKSTSSRIRGGNLVLLIGFAISGTMSLVFNLILPFWTWNYIWAGPLAISATIIAFYYTILRYRALNIASWWLKVFSYIVMIASSAVVYMMIFAIVFFALFRGATPSTEVIILNFIMIMIVVALLPAASELSMFIRSLISNHQIDMVYIVKKIANPSGRSINIKELASFLAEHMHFEYIGILVDGQIYSSSPRRFSTDDIKFLMDLKNPKEGIWQEVDESSEIWGKMDLSAVAILRDGGGHTYGQILFGTPSGRSALSQREIIKIETIVNLTAMSIDSKVHKKVR